MFYCLQVKSRPFASLSSQEKDVTKKKEQGDIKYNTTKAITKTRHALQRDWKKAATAAREHPAVAVAVGVVATYTALRVGIEVSLTTGLGELALCGVCGVCAVQSLKSRGARNTTYRTPVC